MKKFDIFAGKYYWWVLGLVALFVFLSNLFPEFSSILWILFFLILGSVCLWNYKNCGRVHCKITGVGFIGVAILILLTILEIVPLTGMYLNVAIISVIVIGYGYEFWYKSKNGSCYQ